jgi:hypothetical protein
VVSNDYDPMMVKAIDYAAAAEAGPDAGRHPVC